MSDTNEFKEISFATARTLAQSEDADFAVYLPSQEDDQPVLYRERAAGLSSPDFERMQDGGVESLLIRTEDINKCGQLIEAKLSDLLACPDASPAEKAEVLHTVGRALAEELISTREASPEVHRAAHYVDSVVRSLLDDPAVSGYVLQMAEYQRSTASHMMIVSALAVLLGTEVFGEERETLADLGLAGLLHDLGKLGIDPAILNKTTPLDREEINMIEQHPIESVRLIGDAPQVSMAARQMIIQHHERTDGQGYPVRVSGPDLLVGSQVLSIVDTFHAMIGRGFYHGVLTVPEAIRAIERQAGRQFDEDLVGSWISLFNRLRADRLADSSLRHPADEQEEGASRHEHRTFPRASTAPAPNSLRTVCDGRTTVKCLYAGRLPKVTTALDEFVAPLQDLYRGGLCLYTPHPIYQGEVIHARVRASREQVWVRGTVQWCSRQGDHLYKTSLRFLERISEAQAAGKVPVKSIKEMAELQSAHRKRDQAAKESKRKKVKTPRQSALESLTAIAEMPRITRAKCNIVIALSMSGDPEVRLRALGVLKQIPMRSAREALLQMLEDPLPAVRKQALAAVGALELIDAVGRVRELVGDADREVSAEAAKVLQDFVKTLRNRDLRRRMR